MTKTNPIPKAHIATKHYMKTALGREMKIIRRNLANLESELAETVFSAVRMELDGAIESAYWEGFEEGKKHANEIH